MGEWVKEKLRLGQIRISKSPYSANTTSKLNIVDGSRRWCIDYRGLNAQTVKDKTPLPLIETSFALLGQAEMFTNLDLRSAFHQVLLGEESREKTAFLTRTGLMECVFMPFGLTNAPATMQAIVNNALRGLADRICVNFVDDIQIFSIPGEDHVANVRAVSQALIEAKLFVKAERCRFHKRETMFLGHIISPECISMDPDRNVGFDHFNRLGCSAMRV
jgi:hypothetical protein